MNQETLRIIDSISREKNIDKETLIRDIEAAMVSAARRHFQSLDTEEFGCEMDRLTGQIKLWRNLPMEYDEETGDPVAFVQDDIDIAVLGRIPAQTAKQVMIQRFREDERNALYAEYSKRIGEIVTGTAQRYEGRSLIVALDRAEGFMPPSQQIPGEQFQPNDRVRCLILDVREEGTQVRIVLSRAADDFIRRLFEVEVPEVSERIIEIKAMSREPGFRTKLAVSSIDSKVDAVGACVGVRGSRIKNIVDELGGEKIDIVRWNESSQVLIQNALKPAEVKDVSLCFELGRATVIVEDDQLSLAIGKRGQNVRLAAHLTGWDIDILTPAEYSKGLEILVDTLKQVEGVSEEVMDHIAALGMISVFDVEEVGAGILLQEIEITEEQANAMVEKCAARARLVSEEQQRDRELADQKRAADAAAASSVLDAVVGAPSGAPDAAATASGEDAKADAILGGGGGGGTTSDNPATNAGPIGTSGAEPAASATGTSAEDAPGDMGAATPPGDAEVRPTASDEATEEEDANSAGGGDGEARADAILGEETSGSEEPATADDSAER